MGTGNGQAEAVVPPPTDGVKALLNAATRIVELQIQAEQPDSEGIPPAVLRPREVLRQMREAIDYQDAKLAPPDAIIERTIPEWLDEARKLLALPRIPLGLPGIDELIQGGVLPRWLIILGAFAGGGKTSTTFAIALGFARRGHPVYFSSAEGAPVELAMKGLIAEGDAIAELHNFTISPAEGDIFQVLKKARAWHARQDAGGPTPLIVFDYLQKYRADDVSRERQVAIVAEAIQAFGRSTEAVVIAAAQLNRKSKEETPALHHLRESGLIEQVADIALLLSKNGDRLHVLVGKNRWGKAEGEVDLAADWERLIFTPETPLMVTSTKKPSRLTTQDKIAEVVQQYHGQKDENGQIRAGLTYAFIGGKLRIKAGTVQSHMEELEAVKRVRVQPGGGKGKLSLVFPPQEPSP